MYMLWAGWDETWCENINKKFWEELIAYFSWYDIGHIENDASNNSSIVVGVFITAVTFLPSRCLAMIGGCTYRHTDWWEGFFNWSVEMGSGAVIKFYKDWLRHSKVNGGDTQTHTQTATWSHKLTLFFQNKESRLKSSYEFKNLTFEF
jgi:hypothetical protein